MAQEGRCTIGRIGVTAANGGDGLQTLQEPHTIDTSGDAMTISGSEVSATADIEQMMWLRDMILGLSSPGGEPIIPCTFASFEHLDGYYRVASSSANRSPGSVEWSVDLERIRDWRNPSVEIFTVARIITNSHGITLAGVFLGAPGDVEAYYGGDNVAVDGTADLYANADGGNQTVNTILAHTGYTSAWTQRLYVAPAKWYKYGCRIGYDVQNDPFTSAGSYLSVVGRRSFPSSDIITRIAVSNGLVRVVPHANGLSTYWWDGSAWDGPTNWSIGDTTAGVFSFLSASVLRNTPEECSIRILGNVTGLDYGPINLDVTVRRGNRTFIGQLTPAGFQTAFTYYVEPNPTVASTSISGGLRRTSNDSFGNRPFVVSDNATTMNTGTGRVAQASAGSPLLFGIGNEVGGSGLSVGDPGTASRQLQAFFMGQAETQMVASL